MEFLSTQESLDQMFTNQFADVKSSPSWFQFSLGFYIEPDERDMRTKLRQMTYGALGE
ncbi:MAG: hypothetical protein GY930_16275 [bacterium]|nr:hypothetical protein [bacterium]